MLFNSFEFAISWLEIHYLDKILSLCNDKSIHVLLLNTPLAEAYRESIPSLYKKALSETIVGLNEKYKNFEYLDFSELSLADSCYSDNDHVNHYGANLVSGKLNNYLNESAKVKINMMDE